MPIVGLLLWLFPIYRVPFLVAQVLAAYLVLVLVIDLEHKLILHPVSITGALLCAGIGILYRSSHSIYGGLITTVVGGLIGFLMMLAFYFLGELFVKYMSKRRGLSADEVALGFGDVNLTGILGLLLGMGKILPCLFLAILAGGVVSLFMIIIRLLTRKYKAFYAIPYAPFLILGAVYNFFILR